MKKKEHCPHCGQSIMKHRQSLAGALSKILIKAAAINAPQFHLQKDINFTKNEYTNFQKLKFWRLVERVNDKAGYWRITDVGHSFLNKDIPLSKWLFTFNNRPVEWSDEKVFIDDIAPHFEYRKRDDYISDMKPVAKLVGQKELF